MPIGESARGYFRMKLWVPVAMGAVIAFAYAFFYLLSSFEAQSAATLGLANSVGLVVVLLGILAAAFILRRTVPPQ